MRKPDTTLFLFYSGLTLNALNALAAMWAVNPFVEMVFGFRIYGPIAFLIGVLVVVGTLYGWVNAGFSGRVSWCLGIVLTVGGCLGLLAWGLPPVWAAAIAGLPLVLFRLPYIVAEMRR